MEEVWKILLTEHLQLKDAKVVILHSLYIQILEIIIKIEYTRSRAGGLGFPDNSVAHPVLPNNLQEKYIKVGGKSSS